MTYDNWLVDKLVVHSGRDARAAIRASDMAAVYTQSNTIYGGQKALTHVNMRKPNIISRACVWRACPNDRPSPGLAEYLMD